MKIEARPIADKAWEYSFYIDFYENIIDEKVNSVQKAIKGENSDCKFLGNYISEVSCG